MFISGTPDYSKDGEKRSTGLFAGLTAQDGELKSTKTGGKRYGAVSVRAFNRKDGSAVFLTIKSFHTETAELLSNLRKGDRILAAGIVETREYNGKTYTDMLCDILLTADMAPAVSAPPAYAPNPFASSQQPDFAEISEEDGELPF